MPILGKPILEHIINFLKHSKLTDQIIVATSNLTDDDKIEELSKTLGIDCYRGDANDVLGRYYECAKLFKGDLIVRITADNPLIDPNLVDEIILLCKTSHCDYASNMIHQTYPVGYLVEAMTFKILEKVFQNDNDPLSREHVTYSIRKNPHIYNVKEVFAPLEISRPDWRLTVDYIEDYMLITEIFSKLYNDSSFISYREVVEFIDNNKDLLKINQNN